MNLKPSDHPLPRISIVTPSYNHGEYLEACLDSVLSQGYGNLEYIVIDGGSTDASPAILRKYERHLTYWHSRPDGGLYHAVDWGLRHATGDILAYLNADDFYHPDTFAKVSGIFSSRLDVQWLTGRGCTADRHGRIIRVEPLRYWSAAAILNVTLMAAGQFIQQDATFWRASLWRAAGGYLSRDYDLAGDYELWARFVRHAELHSVDDLLSCYRYHGDNLAMTHGDQYLVEACQIAIRELQRPEAAELVERPARREALPTGTKVYVPPAAENSAPRATMPRKPDAGVALTPWLREANQQVLRDAETKAALLGNESTGELIRALQAEEGMVRLVTIDIFDTLVFRYFRAPHRLFALLGLELEKERLLAPGLSGIEFAPLRVAAETRARRRAFNRCASTEVKLAEIYDELGAVVTEPARALAAELECEARYGYLNQHVAQLIAWLKAQGLRVGLISDSYLTAAQLRALLERLGFDCALIDRWYVSCEEGVPKDRGRLFQVMLQAEGLHGCQALHLGDHPDYDVRSGGLAGIKAVRYGYDEPSAKVQEREAFLHSELGLVCCPESLRTSARLLWSKPGRTAQRFFVDGACLFGPVLTLYADWCVRQFKRAGLRRVWCLMREGELLKRFLDQSARKEGLELATVPFFVSRLACLLPSLERVDLDALRARPITRGQPTVAGLLARYGIPAGWLGLDRFAAARVVAGSGDQEDVLRLLAPDRVLEAVRQCSVSQRQALHQYLRQCAEGESRVGVVDVGWRGTIQRDLLRVIAQGQLGIELEGFYLGTVAGAADALLDGVKAQGFLCHVGRKQSRMAAVADHPEILEQVLSAPCGSTVGYRTGPDGRIEPVLAPHPTDERDQRQRQHLWDGMLTFQREWLRVGHVRARQLEAAVGEAAYGECVADYAAAILARLWSYPLAEEAQRYGNFEHDANNGVDDVEQICTEANRARYREQGYDGLRTGAPYWPQGVIALEDPEAIESFFLQWQRSQR